MKKAFYGGWITAAAVVTFGLSTGLPYYNIGFFYDYFAARVRLVAVADHAGLSVSGAAHHLGRPAADPPLQPAEADSDRHRVHVPRTGRLWDACAARCAIYYLLWVVYTVGYILSGPIPHQIIVSNWYRLNRGKAMGIVYVGVGLIGALGSYIVKPLTAYFGFPHRADGAWVLMFLTWPVALFVLKDSPAMLASIRTAPRSRPANSRVQSALVPRSAGQLCPSGCF